MKIVVRLITSLKATSYMRPLIKSPCGKQILPKMQPIERNRQGLHWFPIAAVTNNPRFGGLKPHTLVTLQFWMAAKKWPYEAKSKGCVPSSGSRGERTPCLFQLLEASTHFLACDPISPTSSPSLNLTFPLPTYKDP